MYREIVFRLTAENHPDLASRLSGFVNQVRQAQAQINTVQLGAGGSGMATGGGSVHGMTTTAQRVAEEKKAASQIIEVQGSLGDLRARVESDRQRAEMSKLNKFLDEKLALEKRYNESLAAINQGLKDQGLDPNDPSVKAAVSPMLEKAKEAYYAKERELAEKADAEQARLVERATARKLAAMENETKASEKAAAAEKERSDREIAANEKALETAENKHQSLLAQIKSAEKETLTAFASIGESSMRVARGFVAIGLAGEEDLKKVVQALLKVQGAFDIISGGIQTWQRIQAIIESTRKTILLTAAAEEALGKAAAARAAIQAVGGSTGSRVGSLVGDAASMSGARLLGKAFKSLGGRALGVAGGVAVGATIGLGVGLAADYFSGDGYSRGGFGEWAGTGFVGARNLGAADKYLGLDTPFSRLADSDKALSDQERRAASHKQMMELQNAAVARGLPDVARGLAGRRQASGAMLSADLDNIASDPRGTTATKSAEASKRIAQEILSTEQRIAELKEEAGATSERHESVIKAYNQEQLELERTKASLVAQRAEVSRSAAEAELNASERQLRNVEATLEVQQQALQTMKEQLMSAQERFGLMDEDKQAELIDLFKRAKAGEQLDPEELRNLNSLGSIESEKMVRDQALRRAQAAGADALFGGERDKINSLEGDIARNVDVAADIRWEVSFDRKVLEEQTAALQKVIQEGIQEQADKAAELVGTAMSGVVGGIVVRIDGIEQRIANGAGARN